MKIKSPAYVALTLLRGLSGGAVGSTHMLEIVRTNEGGEFLAAFPEYKALHRSVATKYEALVAAKEQHLKSAEEEEEDDDDEGDDKAFAEEMLKSKQTNVRTFLSSISLDRLHCALGLGSASTTAVDNKKAAKAAGANAAALSHTRKQKDQTRNKQRKERSRGKRGNDE